MKLPSPRSMWQLVYTFYTSYTRGIRNMHVRNTYNYVSLLLYLFDGRDIHLADVQRFHVLLYEFLVVVHGIPNFLKINQ